MEEDIVASIYKNVVANSVAYMMMSRLGIDTEGYFELDDFRDVTNFNTQEVTVEDVKRNLGRPIVDYDNGKVTYCEQSFDDCHIFEFEFMDDAFEKLQYFSIDG